jgi:hypothetical protein
MVIQLVMDGMRLQPCDPGFVDGRDAILQADALNFGGVNVVISRRGDQLIERLLQDQHSILFEGLHSCYYLADPRL